jgi:hypothetical protein
MLAGLLHLLGHLRAIGILTYPSDEKTRSLASSMLGYSMPDFPIARSIASLYLGLSLAFSALMLLLGAVIILVAVALADRPAALRSITRIYLAGLLVLNVISINYFVWPPTVCLLVAFGLTAFAMARLRKA